jgi:putative aldouronate transport system permease protein
MKRLDRTEIIFKVLSYVLLTIFAVICIYPLIYVVAVALSDTAGYNSNSITLLPLISNGHGGVQVGIAWGSNNGKTEDGLVGNAFYQIVSQRKFWFSYANTIFYAFYGTLVSMVVGITGAYALSKPRLMFGRGFNFLLTFTMWFSAGIIATFRNFQNLHIDNKYGFVLVPIPPTINTSLCKYNVGYVSICVSDGNSTIELFCTAYTYADEAIF